MMLSKARFSIKILALFRWLVLLHSTRSDPNQINIFINREFMDVDPTLGLMMVHTYKYNYV